MKKCQCTDEDEPIIEITEDEEQRPNISSYVFNPHFKSSTVIPSNGTKKFFPSQPRHGDTVIGNLPLESSRNKLGLILQKTGTSPMLSSRSENERDSTPKRNFNSGNNPHDLIRCAQKEKYV